MKIFKWLPALLIFFSLAAKAQFNSDWDVLSDDGNTHAQVSNFASVSEARTIIDEIISVMNLKVNFEVREANVPNAGAVFYNNKRYILYNPVFIRQIDRAAQTDWAAISILAHEMGHHVKGHTFKTGGNSHQQELEADEFSGEVLKKMGATLEEAQLAMNMIATDRASSTHPGKAERLDAIAKGWNAVNAPVGNDMADARANTSNTRATVAVNRTTSTASVTGYPVVNTAVRESALPDKNILVDVKFSSDQNNQYFITVDKQVVRWDGHDIALVGKLATLKNQQYPFYIYDSTKNYYLISKDGYLVSPQGAKSGYLSMHTTASTAQR